MDRPGLGILLTFALGICWTVASCGSTTASPHVPLGPRGSATIPSSGRHPPETRSKDTLAYRVAFAGPHLVSVELTTRVALVIQDREAKSAQARRVDLGVADFDVLALETTGDGKRAFVASAAGWVRAYQLDTGDLLSEWHMGSEATALAVSDDDAYLAIGTATGVLCLRRLRDAAQLQCVAAHSSRVAALDVHNHSLVSGDWSGTSARWALPSLREVTRLEGDGFISDVAISPDGETLAIARNRRRPIRSPELSALEKKRPAVDAVGHNVIELRDLSGLAREASTTLAGHRSVISALAWVGPDLISTSWDRTVLVWNTEIAGTVRTLLKSAHLFSDVATSAVGGYVAIAGWATEDGQPSVRRIQLLYPKQ